MNIYTLGLRQCPIVWWRKYPELSVHLQGSHSKGVSLLNVQQGDSRVILKQNTSGRALTRLPALTDGEQAIVDKLLTAGVATLAPAKKTPGTP